MSLDANILLRFESVTLTLGERDAENLALNNLCFDIPLGRHTALLGPNGSGKSSILRLLMRLLYPNPLHDNSSTDGVVHSPISILGRSDWNVWELRKLLGYIASDLDATFSHGRSGSLQGYEAVLTGFYSHELRLDDVMVTNEMIDRADHLLEEMGVSHLRNRKLLAMSTGERRRVLLARALVHKPKGLILDEPTSGLDIRARISFLEELERIAACGTTIILVTHHVEEIFPAINHCLMIRKGEVVYDGDRLNGLTEARLSDLFHVQLEVRATGDGYITALPRSHKSVRSK